MINKSRKREGLGHLCGKYYGIYDEKRDGACVGIFESTAEICAFFGGIKAHRVSKSVMLNYAMVFGKDRFKVEVFIEPTKAEARRVLRQRFGTRNYKISEDGIYIRQTGQSWEYYAPDAQEAVWMTK